MNASLVEGGGDEALANVAMQVVAVAFLLHLPVQLLSLGYRAFSAFRLPGQVAVLKWQPFSVPAR